MKVCERWYVTRWYIVIALLVTGHCQIIHQYSYILYVGMVMMNILEHTFVQQFVLRQLSSVLLQVCVL